LTPGLSDHRSTRLEAPRSLQTLDFFPPSLVVENAFALPLLVERAGEPFSFPPPVALLLLLFLCRTREVRRKNPPPFAGRERKIEISSSPLNLSPPPFFFPLLRVDAEDDFFPFSLSSGQEVKEEVSSFFYVHLFFSFPPLNK